MDRVSQQLTQRVKELAERYETPLPQMVNRVAELEAKVNRHLEQDGVLMEVKPGYKQTEVGVIPEDWDVHSSVTCGLHHEGSATRLPMVSSGKTRDCSSCRSNVFQSVALI